MTVVFNPGFDAFRSNTLLEIDPGKITEISWMRPESDSAILIQASPHLDSFLRDIRFLAGISFADAFDPVRNAQNLEGSITFYTTQWEPPLEVAYYRDTLQDPHFIFSSSWNPDNYFSSDSSGLFGRLVLPLYSFLEPMPIDSATH